MSSLDTNVPTKASNVPDRLPKAPRKSGSDFTLFEGVSQFWLVIWTAIVILPLLWTLVNSFRSTNDILTKPFSWPTNLSVDAYKRSWDSLGIQVYLGNTLLIVSVSLILVMLLGAMTAYVLARHQFRGSNIVYYLILAGNTFPIFLAVVPLFFILRQLGLVSTYQGLILTYVAYAYPFTVFFLFSFFKTLPKEIQEAASIDGAGEWRTFFTVMLPMAKNGMVSVAIFNFLGLWNQFLLPQVLMQDDSKWVLSQKLVSLQNQLQYRTDYSGLFASVIITVVPVLVVYLIFQRQLQGGVSQGTMK